MSLDKRQFLPRGGREPSRLALRQRRGSTPIQESASERPGIIATAADRRSGEDALVVFAFPDLRLRRSEARDRHPRRRARNVIQARPVAETDRLRMPAVLAADADDEIGTSGPAPVDGELHQPADALDVERLERVVAQDAGLD